MNESLRSKLARLLSDEDIYQVDILMKCKTKDGMIYTLDVMEYRRDATDSGCLPYADYVYTGTMQELLRETELVAKEGFTFSDIEMVSIKNSEIVRVWTELGDLYTEAMPIE